MSGSVTSIAIKDTFSSSTKTKPSKKKRTPPLSIRFSDEERALLKQRAGSESLSAYIRQRALDGDVTARKTRGRTPIKDHEALARVLSALGRSELHKTLSFIISLSEIGALFFDEEEQDSLRIACADIAAMRSDLVAALGLRSECES